MDVSVHPAFPHVSLCPTMKEILGSAQALPEVWSRCGTTSSLPQVAGSAQAPGDAEGTWAGAQKPAASGRREAVLALTQRATCCVEEPGEVEGTGDWGSASPNYYVFLGKSRASLSLRFLNCQ